MTDAMMTAALLHGVEDLRVQHVPVPDPAPGELLIKIEACGVCPTDARKFAVGLTHGEYPLNPGHEWLGRVVRSGDGDDRLAGLRVYGDTYGGYAEYATIGATSGGWSFGALELSDDLPVNYAVFVEPLADCLHAIHDQAQVEPGHSVIVLGAGQMGLQLIAAAALAGARVVAVEPIPDRRDLALTFGADAAISDIDGINEVMRAHDHDPGADAVIVSIPRADVVRDAVNCARPGGRIVLFAGFGDRPQATLDLNQIHYREISLIGSEWIGVPPKVKLQRYEQARDLLVNQKLPVDKLVTNTCGFDGLEDALRAVRAQRQLKVILIPGDKP